jgi:hypothetical protein
MHYTQKNNSPEKYSETPKRLVCITYPKKKIPCWYSDAFDSFNEFIQDHAETYTHPEKSWEKYQKILSKEKHKKDKIEKEQPYKSTLYTSPY